MADIVLTPGWATYLRVSSEDKQSPERSFAMQRKRISEVLIAESGLPIYREYRDKLSGTTARRDDYQQLLTDAAAGRFSHLGLYRADRFGRDTVEGLQAANKCFNLGIKIRVAHMPSLQPENPDGFLMFLIQMGVAQYEVDLLSQRVAGGIEAKLRAGGWAFKAPLGYVNKEQLIRSGKYERWVEQDPEIALGLRKAWDLLLTDRYTLAEICEELNSLGFTRSNGLPWAWDDPRTAGRRNANNRLHEIFHNPFYAGWVVSERYKIAAGEVRGNWDPIVTTQEFDRGVTILRKHDAQKSRTRSYVYLLHELLWVEADDDRCYKMYVTTPSGRSKSYSYYFTKAKLNGKKLYIPCTIIDEKIPDWLTGIGVDSDLIPSIRDIYESEVDDVSQPDVEEKKRQLKHRLAELHSQEAHLGRLLIQGLMSEDAYKLLRSEWQEKVQNTESNLANLQDTVAAHLDDLDTALLLLARLEELYKRLPKKQQARLLQILAKRIIVNRDGEIIDHELYSPFAYLTSLKSVTSAPSNSTLGSEQFRSPSSRELLCTCDYPNS